MNSTLVLSAFRKTASAAALLLALILLASPCFGQQLTGTLSATISDAAGAVVPNAKVTMKNEASGDVRTTVSNGSGYFATMRIAIIAPGNFDLLNVVG